VRVEGVMCAGKNCYCVREGVADRRSFRKQFGGSPRA
jgi:hypothetical protein